jgi:hypothetical protein
MNAPASNSARKLNGGQALAEMLKLSGVGPMFGMGGFQLLPFYEAMRALGLRHFLIKTSAAALRVRRLCACDQPTGRVRCDPRPRHAVTALSGRSTPHPRC